MLLGQWDSAAWAKAIGVFQVGHARNQHWSPPRSKRRKRIMAAANPNPTLTNLASITIRRPDDWHVHLRDGAMLAACAVHTARQFGRAIIMPNLVPPVTRVAEASAYRDRIRAAVPAERELRAADDLLPDRRRRSGRADARQGRGRVGRGQALSGACHHQLRARRDLDGPRRARAGGHGEGRHAAAGPWRGDRSRGRHLRPRGGVPGQGAGAAAEAPCGPEDRAGAHHDPRGRGLRRGQSRPDGRHDHAASSQLQPQCDLQGRHPSALLLPADRQARGASSRSAEGGDFRRYAILPRHRHRAAHDRHQGMRLRLRRRVQRPGGDAGLHPGLRRGGRARPARSLRLAERPALLWPRGRTRSA